MVYAASAEINPAARAEINPDIQNAFSDAFYIGNFPALSEPARE